MTAFLYQRASLPAASWMSSWIDFFTWILLRLERRRFSRPIDEEDMRGSARARAQLNVIAGPVPRVARVGQEIMHLEGDEGPKAKLLQGQIDPAGLHPVRIKIDHDQDHILEVVGDLAIGNQGLVVGAVIPKMVERMQSAVFAAKA